MTRAKAHLGDFIGKAPEEVCPNRKTLPSGWKIIAVLSAEKRLKGM